MKFYYKIMDSNKEKTVVKTLFHGNEGSRTVPMETWLTSSRDDMVTDGSKNTPYKSGWHVMESLEEAMYYLYNNFKNLDNKVIVKCLIAKDIRQKKHSRANIWLAQKIFLEEIVHHVEKDSVLKDWKGRVK